MSPFEKVILRKRPIAIQLSLYYGIGRYVSINLLKHIGAQKLLMLLVKGCNVNCQD